MALNLHILVLILSLSFIPAHFSDVSIGRKGLIGGWVPIKDPTDPKIQEISKFAVSTYDKNYKENLVYQSVIKGETQAVAGTNYRLIITAKDNGALNNYEAIVFDQPWTHTRTLTSFKQYLKP